MAFVPNLRTLRVALVPQQMKTSMGRLANTASRCRCPSCGDAVEVLAARGTDASGDMLRAYDACPRCNPVSVGPQHRAANCVTLADHRKPAKFHLPLAA